jgi:hypothetical protein
MGLDEDKKESTVQRPGSYPASACKRIVRTQRLTIYCFTWVTGSAIYP